jgi:uncharacterized protein (DUF58 family)
MSNKLAAQLLDWGSLAPLRLRANQVTAGLYAGNHRSIRRGSGIEFDGHRDYVPGDDLRRLDGRALLRHDKLLVRQFETETERCLCLLVDATDSMRYKSKDAPGAKLAYAALLAAALGKVTLASADTISLDWVGGQTPLGIGQTSGGEAFERLVGALEHAQPGGEEPASRAAFETSLIPLARRARRGSVVVLFSDLIDLPAGAAEAFAALSSRTRTAVTVRVLDPVEATFPFEGAVRLRPSGGASFIETDGKLARAGYLKALAEQAQHWHDALLAQGGRLVTCQTTDAPIDVVRQILRAAAGGAT